MRRVSEKPCVVMSVFQEARCLPMALGTLPDDARVIVVDGAYKDFPCQRPYSTDGTIEIARRWGAEVVEVRTAWPDQVAKRTLTLGLAPLVFVLDADELLYTDMPLLPEGYDVGWVWVRSPIYPAPYLEPRVFRVRPGWHYDKRHHWIYDADGALICSHTTAGASYRHCQLPVVIGNMRNWRTEQRNHAKHAYGKRRNRQELQHADV